MAKHIMTSTLMAAVAAGGLIASAGEVVSKELRLAHFVPARHHIHTKVFVPMAAELAKISGGKLTIKIFPGGSLGKGPREQYKRAIDRIADMTFSLQGYTSQQFPRTLLAELPNLASSPPDATERLWKAYDHVKADYKDVRVLGLWMIDHTILISKDKPITKLSDLKGLKIRTPSRLAGGLLKKWGAIPVAMPAPKIYQQFQTGIIDAVFIGTSGVRSFKLNEVGKYYTINLPKTYTAQFLVMNKTSYAELNDQEKKWLNSLSGKKLSMKAADEYEKAGLRTEKFITSKGGKLVKLSADEQKKFSAAADAYVSEVIAAREKAGIKAKALIGAMKGTM